MLYMLEFNDPDDGWRHIGVGEFPTPQCAIDRAAATFKIPLIDLRVKTITPEHADSIRRKCTECGSGPVQKRPGCMYCEACGHTLPMSI